LRAGFSNRETEDAETVGAEKSTPVVRQRTLRPRLASKERTRTWGTRLKAPPSRKEREKGRAPGFVCCESMGQPPILASHPFRKERGKNGAPDFMCGLELRLEEVGHPRG
jgi:hypothetical protein